MTTVERPVAVAKRWCDGGGHIVGDTREGYTFGCRLCMPRAFPYARWAK